ncbi:hypothetical protein CXIVA_13010 [Clostridium sp. SY8519]|nr:hypothetical protein CXIVA_13010 [Clostridium sp. SY8519]
MSCIEFILFLRYNYKKVTSTEVKFRYVTIQRKDSYKEKDTKNTVRKAGDQPGEKLSFWPVHFWERQR